MDSRKILFLQFFITVAAFLFVGFYVEISILPLLILLLFVFVLGTNIFRVKQNKNILPHSVWGLLVGSFFLYAFVGLGNINIPQSFERVTSKKPVVLFDLKSPKTIDKMCYYVGIDKNVNFVLEYQKQGVWTKYYSYDKSYPYSFRWKCIPKTITAEKILLRVTKNEMMLNEVRFISKGKSIPYVTEYSKLNDETQIKIDTSYYSGMYFDEIYHGRTAYEIMNNIWVYENTHPYLGKVLLIPGIKVFGMSPFGWRVSNVLFAGLLVFMAYYFALMLFKEKFLAFGAGMLMTFSFMHFTQARLAHIDTFGVLFVFLSYYLLYQFIVTEKLSRLFLSGFVFGLAAGVKWAAIFASLGFVAVLLTLVFSKHVILKRFKVFKLVLYGMYAYVLVAAMAYLLTFPQMYFNGSGLQAIIDYNLNMYNYHSGMTQTHAYSSQWWSWPLDMKPMGYYKHSEDGFISSISAFGNPAIFWLGIIAIGYLLVSTIRKITIEKSIILFGFSALYLPYIFVGRLMFIYHFYYALPFLMLAIIYMFKDMIALTKYTYGVFIVYLLVVVGLFLLFYPVISGHQMTSEYVNHYLKWFDAWWF